MSEAFNPMAVFIRRPVATSLLTVGVALAGLIGYQLLPVSPLPQVDFPTISVQASLPGANPETMATSVATPLERQLGRIAGVTEMTSSSSTGSARINLQFELDRSIDGAARDVEAAINAARGQLPSDLRSNPTYRKVNPADAPIMILGLTSKTLSPGQMYDAASTIVAQKVSQVRGVGQVNVGGSSLPAVRIDLNLNALNQYGIALETVRTAIAATNAHRPIGFVERDDRHWQIYTNDQAREADAYRNLVITFADGAAVHLRDIATVTDSVEDVRNKGSANGEPSVLLIVTRQPGANIIETVDRITAMVPQLQASIPADIKLQVVNERTSTIRASLREVEFTLLVSITLVIAVVFLFLRSGRATLIPAVAVPVSLIGTFAVMYLCGYSIDNLSLMALTIATGFVVDDAIVVLENITRHIEAGMERMQAALLGAREVGFTVLSISLSLVAVFIPILLMGGIVGRLFREFAVTLSVAIMVSLAVSLSTTPMICARVLVVDKGRRYGWLLRNSERAFAAMHRAYERGLTWALRHGRAMMVILLCTVGLNIFLYVIIPKGFFPQEDTGRMVGGIQADQSISFQSMSKKFDQFLQIVNHDPAVDTVVGFTGGGGGGGRGGGGSGGFVYIQLKPLKERKLTTDAVIARLRGKFGDVAGASLFLQPVQDVRVGGRQSNALYQYTLQGDDLQELRSWSPKILAALQKVKELADVNSDQQDKGLETSLEIDRATAARLGVTTNSIDQTLYDAFGQRQVSTIYNALNQYHVVMEVAQQYLQSPEALDLIYVPAKNGTLVPLSAFSHYGAGTTPLSVNHQSQFVATTLSFNLAPGIALSDASKAIDAALAGLHIPNSIHGSFQGTARTFQQSLSNEPFLILAALISVYIVLGVLYESYIHPLTILSTLPSAGVGALLALMVCRTEFTLIALIGVILLIGIVKKNAIMMIDFALDAERKHGKKPRDAIFEACSLRFRPIMMTTMAAMLGALPLALGTGEGSEMRRPLGISILGGLLVSQMLTLFTTPVVYLYLDRFGAWAKSTRARILGTPVPLARTSP